MIRVLVAVAKNIKTVVDVKINRRAVFLKKNPDSHVDALHSCLDFF